MSISFSWLERGGEWGLSPLTSPADHQKLNKSQKWAFHFFGWRGWQMGFESIDQPGWTSEVNIILKWAFHFFGWRGVADGVQVHQLAQPIIRSERNPKMSISCFWQERGGGWGLSPSTSSANYQKLNVIQKWAFHFIGWRGMADGVWVHWPVWPTSEVECNTKMSISFSWLQRGGRWGSSSSISQADHQ